MSSNNAARRLLPVWVDFNKAMFNDPSHRKIGVILSAQGSVKDLSCQGIELRERMVLHVYSDDANESGERDDLVAEGTVEFDKGLKVWVVWIDRTQIRHVSDVVNDTNHWASAIDWRALSSSESM
jgi:hypothetical protein